MAMGPKKEGEGEEEEEKLEKASQMTQNLDHTTQILNQPPPRHRLLQACSGARDDSSCLPQRGGHHPSRASRGIGALVGAPHGTRECVKGHEK